MSPMSLSNKTNVVVQAWDMVTPHTISRGFRKAGFSNVAAVTPGEDDLSISGLARRFNNAGQLTEIGRPLTFDSLDHILTEDEGIETTDIATVDDIVLEMQAEDITASNACAIHKQPTRTQTTIDIFFTPQE